MNLEVAKETMQNEGQDLPGGLRIVADAWSQYRKRTPKSAHRAIYLTLAKIHVLGASSEDEKYLKKCENPGFLLLVILRWQFSERHEKDCHNSLPDHRE